MLQEEKWVLDKMYQSLDRYITEERKVCFENKGQDTPVLGCCSWTLTPFQEFASERLTTLWSQEWVELFLTQNLTTMLRDIKILEGDTPQIIQPLPCPSLTCMQPLSYLIPI